MNKDFFLKDIIRVKYKLDFGIAEMEFLFPLKKCMMNINKLGYGNPNSIEYSESIKRWFYIQYGKFINNVYFLYTHSIKYAIRKLIDNYDDINILNFIPCYNGYSDVFTNLQNIFEYNYFCLFEKDFEANFECFLIQNKIDCIVISNPHNPTGRILDRESLEKLASLCSKYNIYMVVDEAYGDIVQKKFFSAIHIDYDKCIVLKTIGKSFNVSGVGGAYLVTSNKEIYDRVAAKIKSDGLISPNIFAYYLTKYLYSSEGKLWLEQINDRILRNKLYFKRELDKKFKNKLNYEITYGAYFAWVNYEDLRISEESFEKILKESGVKVIFASHYKSSDKFFRVNLACGIEKIDELIFSLEKIINKC